MSEHERTELIDLLITLRISYGCGADDNMSEEAFDEMYERVERSLKVLRGDK